jgi:hypothetical protein
MAGMSFDAKIVGYPPLSEPALVAHLAQSRGANLDAHQ